MEEPYMPFYKPYGMSDEEYQYEIYLSECKQKEYNEMIAAKKEWCMICKTEHIEGNHIERECEDCKALGWTCAICETSPGRTPIQADLRTVYNKIVRYEGLGFDSAYIHIAIKEYIKSQLE